MYTEHGMDNITIEGPTRLTGEICVSGAKNAALPILAATILAHGPCTIHQIPQVQDIHTMIEMLSHMGVQATIDSNGTVTTGESSERGTTAPYDIVRKMRGSVCALGPLLARYGEACISLPGGCVIGTRPIDLHLKGLKALGADIEIRHGYVHARCEKLKGCRIFLGGNFGSSVLATDNIMMAACLAEGKTIISGAACEPEVVDLANFLISMGARIEGAGSHTIIVEGVEKLHGSEYTIIPDRIEAGTFLIAGALCAEQLTVSNIIPEHLEALFDAFDRLGVSYSRHERSVELQTHTTYTNPCDITTLPYPGFPTDLQAQMMALLAVQSATSKVTEKVFPDRFMHAAELDRMGAHISVEGGVAVVNGQESLSGAEVMASDLRASAALILAGLVAEGTTTVNRVYHLDRGYEGMVDKLAAVGATIKRNKKC
jgi:UDP-N-acetylglucosamine 1-carboxyvinyltransferase